MKMKTALTVLAAASAMFAQGAFAQAASMPASRADVKAEAATARTPAGEGPGAMTKAPSTTSSKTRMERKGETAQAAQAGELKPAGPATGAKEQMAEQKKPSTKTRMERKAETNAAVKAGATIPAGEGPDAPKK